MGGIEREVETRMAAYAEEKHTSTVAVMHDGRMLMGQRRDSGLWTLPGGGVKPGEDPHHGAIRELFEETGIRSSKMKHLGSQGVVGRSGRPINVHMYQLDLHTEPVTHGYNDPDHEVAEWKWVDITEHGLPEFVSKNLHTPKNVMLKRLGLQSNDFHEAFDRDSDAFVESDEAIVKRSGPYEKPHDDTVPEADPSFGRLAAAGNPADQEPMDALDREAQRYQSRIKAPKDQFPGSSLKKEKLGEEVEKRLSKLGGR
jgi:8-oxo-dGTP pyrophosphatase MutT (NUDIX family)